jgi:hypothetical protein
MNPDGHGYRYFDHSNGRVNFTESAPVEVVHTQKITTPVLTTSRTVHWVNKTYTAEQVASALGIFVSDEDSVTVKVTKDGVTVSVSQEV